MILINIFFCFQFIQTLVLKYYSSHGYFSVSLKIANETNITYRKYLDLDLKYILFKNTPKKSCYILNNESLSEGNKTILVEHLIQTINFETFNINLSLYNIKSDSRLINERISLARYLHNENGTQEPFISQLISKGIIKEPIFAFIRKSDEEGILHFGKIPNHFLYDKYKGQCKLNQIHRWACELKSITCLF